MPPSPQPPSPEPPLPSPPAPAPANTSTVSLSLSLRGVSDSAKAASGVAAALAASSGVPVSSVTATVTDVAVSASLNVALPPALASTWASNATLQALFASAFASALGVAPSQITLGTPTTTTVTGNATSVVALPITVFGFGSNAAAAAAVAALLDAMAAASSGASNASPPPSPPASPNAPSPPPAPPAIAADALTAALAASGFSVTSTSGASEDVSVNASVAVPAGANATTVAQSIAAATANATQFAAGLKSVGITVASVDATVLHVTGGAPQKPTPLAVLSSPVALSAAAAAGLAACGCCVCCCLVAGRRRRRRRARMTETDIDGCGDKVESAAHAARLRRQVLWGIVWGGATMPAAGETREEQLLRFRAASMEFAAIEASSAGGRRDGRETLRLSTAGGGGGFALASPASVFTPRRSFVDASQLQLDPVERALVRAERLAEGLAAAAEPATRRVSAVFTTVRARSSAVLGEARDAYRERRVSGAGGAVAPRPSTAGKPPLPPPSRHSISAMDFLAAAPQPADGEARAAAAAATLAASAAAAAAAAPHASPPRAARLLARPDAVDGPLLRVGEAPGGWSEPRSNPAFEASPLRRAAHSRHRLAGGPDAPSPTASPRASPRQALYAAATVRFARLAEMAGREAGGVEEAAPAAAAAAAAPDRRPGPLRMPAALDRGDVVSCDSPSPGRQGALTRSRAAAAARAIAASLPRPATDDDR